MRPSYIDLPKEGRHHATVAVAFSRVLALVRSAGIPGFQDDEKFDKQAETSGTLSFKWKQGWHTTQEFEVSMTVEIQLTSAGEAMARGLTPFGVRMQWPFDGCGSLATRTAVLDLASQVNQLSARVLNEVSGLFIIHEESYDNWQREKAEKEAEEKKMPGRSVPKLRPRRSADARRRK